MKSRSLADMAKLDPYQFAKADVPAAQAQRTERNHCLLPAVLWTASQLLPGSLQQAFFPAIIQSIELAVPGVSMITSVPTCKAVFETSCIS